MAEQLSEIERLRRINQSLMHRVESVMDQQGNAFSLFQTAISLDGQVKRRTDELTNAVRRFERVNAELEVAKEAAEKANLSKTRFLAAASHDVLQPLNAALLSISVLADLQTSDRGLGLVKQVEHSLETMNELLGTLIDISRLDAGVTQPNIDKVALGPIFESLQSDFMPLARAKGLRLKFRKSDAYVLSDRTMLRRILQNLVSNALRYTENGGVLVCGRLRQHVVMVQITDSGIGIPEEQQDAVFEEFHRGNVRRGGYDDFGAGLGLGLSIVERMAASLGHYISLLSRPDNGTTFRIEVPLTTAPLSRERTGAKQTSSMAAVLTGTRILVLENEPVVIEAMTTLLHSWKCEVVAASTAEEAISALNDTDWIPDLIIADQQLDQGDLGTEVVKAVWAYLGQHLPALIVTADPTERLETTTRFYGLELMYKPIKPASLRALISKMVSG